MSLLFDNLNGNDPQTHVLIIGVGGYPFLKDGEKQKEQSFESAKILGQLTSPPVSAEAFYNTVMKLNAADAWIKPLGSVDVLISPSVENDPALFSGQALERANLNNIKRTYREWKRRCNSHPDNVAIFFFSGHGVEQGEHVLLSEDFGEYPENPWEGSFAFDRTRRSFFTCKANTQLFFIDACRLINSDMLMTEIPLNPIDPPGLTATDCLYNLTQKATAPNQGAYGKNNSVSFYTEALIKALEGGALTNENGEWTIATGTLSSKMNYFIKMVSDVGVPDQRCNSITSDVTDILRFNEPPNIDLTITCTPNKAHCLANLSCHNPQTTFSQRRGPGPDPWRVSIKPGIYLVKADFPNNEYVNTQVYDKFMPPVGVQNLNCI